MAVELSETFRVQAPADRVWAFVMDPERVAACMPGAALDGAEDEQTFLGTIRVKVGAITTSYRGRVHFTNVDEAGRAVEMVAEGRETGGGTARGTMSSRLRAISAYETEVDVTASIEITGRIAQMGRGMIQGVSRQLFQQFVSCAKATLESPDEAPAVAQHANEPVRIVPVALRALWAAITGFFRRLLRRQAA